MEKLRLVDRDDLRGSELRPAQQIPQVGHGDARTALSIVADDFRGGVAVVDAALDQQHPVPALLQLPHSAQLRSGRA